jgi:hypothetical protein
MSSAGHEGLAAETLDREELLTLIENVEECFPLVSGIVGARGETETVGVANYHAPMPDLVHISDHLGHLRASIGSPSTELPLEISDRFKYSFDPGDAWFRIGRGAFLYSGERRIPVQLVSVELRDNLNDISHFHWIIHDKAAQP